MLRVESFLEVEAILIVESILIVKSILIVESILRFESILWFNQLLIFHWHDQQKKFLWHGKWKISHLHDQRILSSSHDQHNFQRKIKKSMNRRWTRTQNLHSNIRQRNLHWTQEQIKRKARRRRSIVSIGNMTRQTHLRAMTLILPMTVITDTSDLKRRNTGKRIQSNNAQLKRQNFWRQHISQRSSGFKWMRIRSGSEFTSSHL